ncbi:MAG: ABC transporter permease [Gemmatimonadaceae bacterium]|nr:ABC transporter permease [Gemmatimonadaceae bacterium]
MRIRAVLREVVTALALAGGILAMLALLLAAAGADVERAMSALAQGALGSPGTFASSTLVRATPLILTGLAVGLAFRTGIINIGADGQLLGGAAAAAAMGYALHGAPSIVAIPFILLAASGAGAFVALGPAILRQRFGVLEVITTIMMNFVVLYAVGFLVRGPLQEPTGIYPQSPALDAAFRLPFVVPGTRLHAGFVLAVVLAITLSWILRYTAAGFRVRVVGANPEAAHVASRINVGRLGMRVFLTSGALAGLAGGVEVTGVTLALYENLSPGYGFTAIAVALLGGLEPLGIAVSGIFFGGLAAGASAMQREAGVPAVLVSVLEAAVILGVTGSRAIWMRRRMAMGRA